MRVVHLLGSAVSTYYEGLSRTYAVACVESTSELTHIFCVVHPATSEKGVTMSFPVLLSEEAERVGMGEGLKRLAELGADVCVPHMFCWPGMTSFRGALEAMNLPFVGCPSSTMAMSTNKMQTKAVVSAVGVKVPKAEIFYREKMNEARVSFFPCVVKPCCEDNSMGVSVVREASELAKALEHAFSCDDVVLCEEFVPLGRELRFGLVEVEDQDGSVRLKGLPCLEYFLSVDHPIRLPNDKVLADDKGKVKALATGGRQCPADVDDALYAKLFEAAALSHKALGCRDYSLYDFRVSPDGDVFLLEACLYCSFSPKSVIVSMANADNDKTLHHPNLFKTLLARSCNTNDNNSSSAQLFGMKKK